MQRLTSARARSSKHRPNDARRAGVVARVGVARAMAGQGRSGRRNSYISRVRRSPGGPEVLTAWVQLWASGCAPQPIVELWAPALIWPVWNRILQPTEQGQSSAPPSPILKLAAGATYDSSAAEIARAHRQRQCVVGASGGAAWLVTVARCLAMARPHLVLLQLGMTNIVGSVRREGELELVTREWPHLVPSQRPAGGDLPRASSRTRARPMVPNRSVGGRGSLLQG